MHSRNHCAKRACEALKKLVTEKEHQIFLHGLMERLEEGDGQRR